MRYSSSCNTLDSPFMAFNVVFMTPFLNSKVETAVLKHDGFLVVIKFCSFSLELLIFDVEHVMNLGHIGTGKDR